MNLRQYVQEPTHDRGHMLDLVITRQDEELVSDLNVFPSSLSDHSVISFKIPFGKPASEKMIIRTRKILRYQYRGIYQGYR